MKKSKYSLISIIILSAILLGACNLPAGEDEIDVDATTIASTSAAVFTHAAETAVVTLPTATTAPEFTAIPTNTLIPTVPPVTATNTPIPCNRASFVKDVTYSDGTEVIAGTTFTKTWRIKNNGSCSWTSGYVLLFDSGEQMGGGATSSITPGTVAPGETIDISVDLTAPATAGTYRGNFKLRSGDNIVFGINADGQGSFYVEIAVPAPTPTPASTLTPPDLIISEYILNPNPPTKNQDVIVSVSVYNQGETATGAFELEWWASTDAPAPACTWSIPSLAGKGGLVKTCTYQYPSWYGSITTKVISDATNLIVESDEGNNDLTLNIQVLDSP